MVVLGLMHENILLGSCPLKESSQLVCTVFYQQISESTTTDSICYTFVHKDLVHETSLMENCRQSKNGKQFCVEDVAN